MPADIRPECYVSTYLRDTRLGLAHYHSRKRRSSNASILVKCRAKKEMKGAKAITMKNVKEATPRHVPELRDQDVQVSKAHTACPSICRLQCPPCHHKIVRQEGHFYLHSHATLCNYSERAILAKRLSTRVETIYYFVSLS